MTDLSDAAKTAIPTEEALAVAESLAQEPLNSDHAYAYQYSLQDALRWITHKEQAMSDSGREVFDARTATLAEIVDRLPRDARGKRDLQRLDAAEQALAILRPELEQLRHEFSECAPYLKDDIGETVPECIERNRKDIDACLLLLAQEKQRAERAEQALATVTQELASIDSLMARRPALDEPTRYANIAKAIHTAGEATNEVVKLKRELELAKSLGRTASNMLVDYETRAISAAQERDALLAKVRALPSPVSMSLVSTSREDGYTHYYCAWCQFNWNEQWVNGVALESPHPDNGCLAADPARAARPATPDKHEE